MIPAENSGGEREQPAYREMGALLAQTLLQATEFEVRLGLDPTLSGEVVEIWPDAFGAVADGVETIGCLKSVFR